jgi:hypothetical protein
MAGRQPLTPRNSFEREHVLVGLGVGAGYRGPVSLNSTSRLAPRVYPVAATQ